MRPGAARTISVYVVDFDQGYAGLRIRSRDRDHIGAGRQRDEQRRVQAGARQGKCRHRFGGGAQRSDDVLAFSVGADYRPFYRFSVLPEYRYERRSSNALNSDYDYSALGVDFLYQYGARRDN